MKNPRFLSGLIQSSHLNPNTLIEAEVALPPSVTLDADADRNREPHQRSRRYRFGGSDGSFLELTAAQPGSFQTRS